MLLSELCALAGLTCTGGDAEIASIEYDSRKVTEGSLFCCIVGQLTDGHKYAAQAAEKGAVALLAERPLEIALPQIVTDNTRKAMALLAAAFYHYPHYEMTMLGVTGTNGKTTTTYMLKSIAEHAGKKVGLIGTIRNMIGERSLNTERTTPESVDLFRILREMADEHVDIVIMEVSSHALEQHRVHGILFDAAAFTNLTQDHLDYHKTFDNYLNAKKILFRNTKQAVINMDDPHAAAIAEDLDIPVLTFGIRDRADINATDIDITAGGVVFDLHTPQGGCRMQLPIPGLFSVFNAMGTVGLALCAGIGLNTIKEGLEGMMTVSGRLEPVKIGRPVPFSVFVDYAHTPDALENVLNTIRDFAKARVITVFGCGGNRDRAKRPIMGEVAGRFSEFAVVTSDNPRNEKPMDIIDAVEEGVKRSGTPYTVIENRKDAITYALSIAEKDDIVLVAGKGHENYQEINGVKYHFDDREIVEDLLKERF
ncbi:MAG: UDP-N-acetylmuramoyl-L-alanyl-D-glutamate--2,6-diaminopimelate ligase [Clostridia bacterium]|nr:UDP-N-acetylmuramoyl-L-alanyl-D-glutamate--2,6-diaminopimelate ligase [Clostridia bacterium]